jgi:hypothetical protein
LALAHPAGEQCSAKCKATGRRCERRVIGGGPCYVHGGNARQVKAKRDQRVLVAEARAAAAAEPVVLERREPEELLIDLLDDVNRILQQIKSELHGNVVSPALLQAAGEWFDRTARVAKTVIDGDLSQKLHARIGWLAAVLQQIKSELHGNVVSPALLQAAGEWFDRTARVAKTVIDGDLSQKLHARIGWLAADRAATCWALLAAIVEASPLSAAQRLQLWESRFDGIRAVQDGSAPARLSGDALHRFADGLLEAAAAERVLADGVMPWDGEDSPATDDLAEGGSEPDVGRRAGVVSQ